MSRSKFLEAATKHDTADEVAALRAQLAQCEAELAALTTSQPDRDRLAKIRQQKADDATVEQFRALPDASSRIEGLANIVSDYVARRCMHSISLDERVEIVRVADEDTLERLRERVVPRSNWAELELLATADEDLPQFVKVTATGAARGSERQMVSDADAERYREAGLASELRYGANGLVAIEGWSLYERRYRIERADTWELRLHVDRDLAALVRAGKIVATPLTPDEVRAGLGTGALQG